jgi:hypothetical protein
MMHRLLIASILASLTMTAARAEDRAALQDMTFALVSDRTACRLVQMAPAGDVVLRLPLTGLCTFHRDATGALRVMDTPEGPVFLIETSHPVAEGAPDCNTAVLAVRVTPDGAVPAPEPARVAACPPFQWDDVMFLGAF